MNTDSFSIHAKKLLSPAGWREDYVVEIDGGIITNVGKGSTGDYSADILIPGYYDLHNHGGEGFDPSSRSFDKLRVFLEKLAQCGVTDVMIGAAPSDPDEIADTFGFIGDAMEMQDEGELGGAYIRGIHMEGPFLNPERPGAIDPGHMLKPDPEAFERLFGEYAEIIDLVTLAPEVDEGFALTSWLVGNGVKVQAGHTDATFEQAMDAFSIGVSSLCHTFNAARPIHHRDPGVITASLLSPNVYCEAICDLEHLHPAALKLIYQCKGASRMVAISDSTMPHGFPDGEYRSNSHAVVVKNGVVRTPFGALSGGICYLDQSVRNLVNAVGIPIEDAVTMASRTPAQRMDNPDVGSIEAGMDAHLAALSPDLEVEFSVVEGVMYE